MPSAAPTARLEARISTELHAMLRRATEIQGRSLTDFVVSGVQDAAQRAIEQGEVVRLSLADSERFARALLSPAGPVAGPGASIRAAPQAATIYLAGMVKARAPLDAIFGNLDYCGPLRLSVTLPTHDGSNSGATDVIPDAMPRARLPVQPTGDSAIGPRMQSRSS